MNKTYRVVLSDDEQKMLAVVLKKENLHSLEKSGPTQRIVQV